MIFIVAVGGLAPPCLSLAITLPGRNQSMITPRFRAFLRYQSPL